MRRARRALRAILAGVRTANPAFPALPARATPAVAAAALATPARAAAVLATALFATAPASAAVARTSLPAIESQVMCVTCKIPLIVAESAQADRERAYIQGLVEQGDSEAQVKRALVEQYGPRVLALPATHGFELAAYLVPVAVAALAVAMLALLLPRWRRRARAQALAAGGTTAPLSPADAARLEADRARFD
jgi:cytochrome c-type biogenesis protein CcmH